MQTPYSVYNLTGDLIAEGTINGKLLTLPAGFYNIKVFGNKTISYDKYQIKGEEEQVIEL